MNSMIIFLARLKKAAEMGSRSGLDSTDEAEAEGEAEADIENEAESSTLNMCRSVCSSTGIIQ